jgi:hypothetical protein
MITLLAGLLPDADTAVGACGVLFAINVVCFFCVSGRGLPGHVTTRGGPGSFAWGRRARRGGGSDVPLGDFVSGGRPLSCLDCRTRDGRAESPSPGRRLRARGRRSRSASHTCWVGHVRAAGPRLGRAGGCPGPASALSHPPPSLHRVPLNPHVSTLHTLGAGQASAARRALQAGLVLGSCWAAALAVGLAGGKRAIAGLFTCGGGHGRERRGAQGTWHRKEQPCLDPNSPPLTPPPLPLSPTQV